MKYETHVTVAGDLNEWIAFCGKHGATPLLIKLSEGDHQYQLMCSWPGNDAGQLAHKAERAGFDVLRSKLEADADSVPTEPLVPVLYWELHAKLEVRPEAGHRGVSQNLLTGRWFMTGRGEGQAVRTWAADLRHRGCRVEVEAVLVDTDPLLDTGWRL